MKSFTITLIVLLFSYCCIGFAQTESLKFDAQQMMKNGKYGEAIELLNRYISANPRNSEGYYLRGKSYEKRGQYEMAVYDYRSALKLDPKNELYNSNLSRVKEEWDKIIYSRIEGYKREIAINPARAINYLMIGKNYKNLGEWQEAEKWYDNYLRREEASADEILRYTEILAKNNHISKGEPILKRYTEMYPDDHRLWSRYGYFTMWLGKKRTAIIAFETALRLRPYFKEALDGYDLARGKGYIYTVNDTTARYNYGLPVPRSYKVYAIDRYYRILKKNPGNVAVRYKLIDELLKHDRYEEAVKQLNVLKLTESNTPNFQSVKDEVLSKREKYYSDKISSLINQVEKNPADRKKIIELGKYYSFLKEYDNEVDLYDKYLNVYSADTEIRYLKAQALTWKGDLFKAKDELKNVLNSDPSNKKYQLLYGQVLVWMNKDLDVAETNLKSVLKKEPNNLQALITLTGLNFQRNDLASAEIYLTRGFMVDPYNHNLEKLENSIKLQAERNAETKLYEILEKAREYAFNKNCDEAINYYNKYFSDSASDIHLKKELAEAYLCKKDYDSAIQIYNDLLSTFPGDYELAKQRAKVYYWMGDSLHALDEFEKLVLNNPDDADAKIYLGDSYMKAGDYANARATYEELLAIAPSSYILQTRMKWLGNAGGEGYSGSVFPAYFSIIPEGYYYNDNLDFTYNKQGARLELGITNYLSLGAGGYFGFISSANERLNLNMFRADIYVKFSKKVLGYAGAGTTNFKSAGSTHIFEAGLKTQEDKKYTFSATFYSTDAAFILYSPFLVNRRLTANYLLLTGEYITKNDIFLRGDYSYTSVSDGNKGSRFIFRIGKIFDDVFGTGYEYYYYNFNNDTPLYWSPDNYESHSLWLDWDAITEESFVLSLKGKVGIIPDDNFILREFYSYFKFYFVRNFFLQATAGFSSSIQDRRGYSSFSFGLSLYWSL